MQTLITLRQLGLAVDESKANAQREITIRAPYRKDDVASLSINLETGVWYDHGTIEGGNIYQLVMKIMNLSFPEAQAFVDGKSSGKTFIPKQPLYDSGYSHPFWTEAQKQILKEAQDRLKNADGTELLEKVMSYDGIRKETLVTFGCGILEWNFNGERKEALLIPYPSGAQVYARDSDGKQMAMLKGSKPAESFMGTDQLSRKNPLIIGKSPRETMLLYQELGATFEVLGTCSGENDKLHDKQVALLKEKANNWKTVFVCRDRDTESAEKLAFGFTRKVCDVIGDFKRDIRLCNIGKLTGNQCKDVTDLLKSEHANRVGELFTPSFSDFVWNTLTHENKFWAINEKGRQEIDESKFVRMLGRFNYTKGYFGEAEEPIIVRDVDNILSNVSSYQLSDFVLVNLLSKFSKYVDRALIAQKDSTKEKLIPLRELEKVFFRYRDKVLSTQLKAIFRPKELNILIDDASTGYLFFKNGTVKVTKDSLELQPFSQINGKIWKSQIMDRTFLQTCPVGTGDLERFVENVAAGSPDNKRSFMSALGYLLHTYKNKANSPAVILVDEKSSPGIAQGGTGKSLFAQSIKHIRAQRYMAGKNVDPSSRFFFMDAQLGDQSLFFDDVLHGFDFEALFNVITDDMQVEAKYKNRFTIPFEQSPKIILATNSVVQGFGNSYRRRQFTLPFSDHYLKNPVPEKVFGRKLFSGWDTQEWARYDHFMIRCLQLYLEEGLIPFPTNYHLVRGLTDSTSPDFYDWAESNLETGLEYKANVLFDGKNKMLDPHNPPREKPMNKAGNKFPPFADVSNVLMEGEFRRFMEWLRQYATFKEWTYNDRISQGYKIVQFTKR